MELESQVWGVACKDLCCGMRRELSSSAIRLAGVELDYTHSTSTAARDRCTPLRLMYDMDRCSETSSKSGPESAVACSSHTWLAPIAMIYIESRTGSPVTCVGLMLISYPLSSLLQVLC